MNQEARCGWDLVKAMMAFRKLDARFMYIPELTLGEFIVLYYIQCGQEQNVDVTAKVPDPPGVRISTLSRRLRHTPPSVSQMVGNLEKRGFVQRNTSTKDRRAVYVSLTGEGRTAMNQMISRMEHISKQLIERFGLEESQTLIRELQRLYRCMESLADQQERPELKKSEEICQERKIQPL